MRNSIVAVSLLAILMLPTVVLAQAKRSLSGYVRDAANGEAQIGVSVYVSELKTGIVTNEYGFYSITLTPGTYSVTYSSMGYEKQTRPVTLTGQNTKLDLELRPQESQLQEVVVSAKQGENVRSMGMGVHTIPMKTIQRIPALFGEVDVIRSIQLLPGVSTVGEGATGFNVRGGSIDQNLVLLDEAPVYNSSHLFGFVSVFNPDAVKDVKLIKAGIPAQYGGRLSSILDVRMKEGSTKKGELSGGIGLLFSRLSYQHPLGGGKGKPAKGSPARGSFIVAARRSYIDVLARPFLRGTLAGTTFNFYDVTAKVNYKLNENNTLYASGYVGRDVFGADFGFNWGNATTSLRWNHVFNSKLFLNTTAFYSKYDYSLDTDLNRESPADFFRTKTSITNYSIKPDFTLYLPKHTVSFGGQTILYDFQSGLATSGSGGAQTTTSMPNQYALESALYVSDEVEASPRIQVQYGLRYSLYNYIGPGYAYTYSAGAPAADVPAGQRRPLTATQAYGRGANIKTYGNLEPRLSAKYELTEASSVKVSYNRLAQYIHLISNSTASTPLDVWTPSTNTIKPQLVDQFSGGYYRNFGPNALYEASVEGYYKRLQNQIDYIDGANLVLNRYIEGDLLSGKGRAYGAEFYLKKNRGVVNGWISYTLAKTERQVDGINNGNWYATRFDRQHNLNVVLLYDPATLKRWNFAATFALASGTPSTFPTNRFTYQGLVVPQNADNARNNYRIPLYHRLDLSATLTTKRGLFGRGTANWVFSVYNVYARQNPFSVYFQQNADVPSQTEAVRFSVFGTVLPSVAYNFKF